jgi:hypothetical protein
MSEWEHIYRVEPVPDTAPFECRLCGHSNRADGPFTRDALKRDQRGHWWICDACMLPYFAARGLMPIETFEARVRAAEETFAVKTQALDEERARLVDVEARETGAVQRAIAAEERLVTVEEIAATATQTIADLERAVREQTERADRLEEGSASEAEFKKRATVYAEIAAARIGRKPKQTTKREEIAA